MLKQHIVYINILSHRSKQIGKLIVKQIDVQSEVQNDKSIRNSIQFVQIGRFVISREIQMVKCIEIRPKCENVNAQRASLYAY